MSGIANARLRFFERTRTGAFDENIFGAPTYPNAGARRRKAGCSLSDGLLVGGPGELRDERQQAVILRVDRLRLS